MNQSMVAGSSLLLEDQAEQQPALGRSSRLITVSPTHKHFSMRAFGMQQIATWAIVLGLLATAHDQFLRPGTLRIWFGVFLVSWLVRMVMFYPLYKLPPSALESQTVLKLFPLLSVFIGSAFWAWTVTLFMSPGPSLLIRDLILFAGFLSISISLSGMWPVTPIVPLISILTIWPSYSYGLWLGGNVAVIDLLALNASVALTIFTSFFLSTLQLKYQVERGAKLDEALASAKAANSQLQILRDAAYKTLESRSTFFAEASHDFQQRVAAARLWVNAAMHSAETHMEITSPLERVGHELDLLQVDFNNVLDFARVETMDSVLSLRTTHLQTIFQTLELRFEQHAARERIDLRIRATHFVVGTDSALLTRVLENLISNALKHTRHRVLVCARRRGDFLAIEVWDCGLGINAEAYERIFEPYHQELSGATGAKNRDGVGLGLAIVRRFAGRLGYTVRVQSVVGKGSVFRVLIPSSLITSSHGPLRAGRSDT
jgi:signal transduction histidine kinase